MPVLTSMVRDEAGTGITGFPYTIARRNERNKGTQYSRAYMFLKCRDSCAYTLSEYRSQTGHEGSEEYPGIPLQDRDRDQGGTGRGTPSKATSVYHQS